MNRMLGTILEQIEESIFGGTAGASGRDQLPELRRLNESVYEFYSSPDGTSPNVEIVFFHGLELGGSTNAYVETWTSIFDSTSFYWPQTWLSERFPRARILCVSYDSSIRKGTEQGILDLNSTAENLLQDLMDENGRVAAEDGCPLILVGKDLGGQVIKAICLRAEKDRKTAFLSNLKGIFYYSTPHLGLPDMPSNYNGALAKGLRVGNEEIARLNNDFRILRSQYKWAARAILARAGAKKCQLVIPEDVDSCYTANEDVDTICKPRAKTSSGFICLVELVNSVVKIQEEFSRRNEICQQEEAKERQEAREREEALSHNRQHLPNEMFGMDIRLQEIESKLENVAKLGIVGMGGVGKTTVAMATFNKLSSTFEYTCFVHDMKLIMGGKDQGKDKVREEVWKRMHCKGKKVEDKEEWFKMKDKRLLLVSDNVFGSQDCEVLLEIINDTSPHSCFIATSRNRDHLDSLEDIYEVPFLDDNDAEKFFLSQAFPNQAEPSPLLANIMKDVVKKCDGLPLTIQVLGRYLRENENDEDWKQTLDALDVAEDVTNFDERLWAKLRMSYEGLKEKEKQMFLDASTFFSNFNFNSHLIHNWTLREAKVAWKAAYKTPSENVLWKTLVDRSLVYDVQDHESIRIHEQLQSLGRRIASEPNHSSQCRVWEKSMAMELLQESSEFVNKEIHAFRLARPFTDLEEISVPSGVLRTFKRLKYLDFVGPVIVDEAYSSESFPSKIVLLRCSGLQIFNPNLQRHLVVLNLDLDVTFLPCSIGRLSSVRIFSLTAPHLHIMPDEIGDLSQLEFLELRLERLHSLPKTFGQLSKIKHLIFKMCHKLRGLPECFGSLSSLKHLEFHDCPKLHALPISFCHLSLERLEFAHCEELDSFPECFGELRALKHLELLDLCNLDSLPKSFCQLRSLQYFKLSAGTERRRGMITKLPGTLAELGALRHFILDGLSVTSLPESIKRMPSLETLELKDLLYVKQSSSWLGETHGAPLALSHKIFRVQDGFFTLTQENTTRLAKDVIHSVQKRAEDKVWALDYDGALADLCLGDLGVLESQLRKFLLKERSNIKRLLRRRAREKVVALDFEGALADLRSEDPGVIEHKLEADLWQERVEVKSLLFPQRAMEKVMAFDYEGALASLRPEDPGMVEPLLEEFLLKERKEIIPRIYEIALSRAMTKMSAGDYEGALVDVRPEDLGVVEPELRETLLRVRGEIILALWKNRASEKLAAKDYEGALADVRPEDPGVVKHKMKRYLYVERDYLLGRMHERAMEKVRAKDYEGALADLRPEEARVVDPLMQRRWSLQAFLLQERGVLKLKMNDLHGALKDLSAALREFWKTEQEFLEGSRSSRTSIPNTNEKEVGIYRHIDHGKALSVRRIHHGQFLSVVDMSTQREDSRICMLRCTYNCRKHLGYVKFLLGDLDGAKEDGEIAFTLLSRYGCPLSDMTTSLGGDLVEYMGFRLVGWREYGERSLLGGTSNCETQLGDEAPFSNTRLVRPLPTVETSLDGQPCPSWLNSNAPGQGLYGQPCPWLNSNAPGQGLCSSGEGQPVLALPQRPLPPLPIEPNLFPPKKARQQFYFR